MRNVKQLYFTLGGKSVIKPPCTIDAQLNHRWNKPRPYIGDGFKPGD